MMTHCYMCGRLLKKKSDVIYELVKEFWGENVSVNIFVNCCGIDVTTIEKPFTVDCVMRTINGTWLPRKDGDV